jgi:predicted RNase H-like nuclease (RuvC/YqgF family)
MNQPSLFEGNEGKMSIDKVQALEERVSKVVELVKNLKEEKSRLEKEVATLKEELAFKKALEEEVDKLESEKQEVRARLEGILKGIEELAP